MVRKTAAVIVFYLVVIVSGAALAAETEETGWVYKPFSRNFDLLIADPRQPAVTAAYFNNPDRGNPSFSASLAGFIAPVRYVDPRRGWVWQLDLEAGFFALFDSGSGFSLKSRAIDYDVGLNVSWSHGPWQLQARLGHLSSHPGDFHLDEENPNAVSMSWEYLTGRASWRPIKWFRLYAGYSYVLSHSSEGVGDGYVQWGLELVSDRLAPWTRLYAAADFKAKEIHDWTIDSSLQAGVRLGRKTDPVSVRLYAFFYSGYSPMAIFQTDWVQRYGVGLGIDF